MKIIIFMLILFIQIQAQSLTYPNGKTEQFVLQIDKSRLLNSNPNRVYYKNGIISDKTRYEDTRKIYVSFKDENNLEQFARKYDLKILKITNRKFHTVLFEMQNKNDVIALCTLINKNKNVRYAKPHWKAPRYLK